MRKVILVGTLGVMLAVITAGCGSTPDKVKSAKYSKKVIKTQELVID